MHPKKHLLTSFEAKPKAQCTAGADVRARSDEAALWEISEKVVGRVAGEAA